MPKFELKVKQHSTSIYHVEAENIGQAIAIFENDPDDCEFQDIHYQDEDGEVSSWREIS